LDEVDIDVHILIGDHFIEITLACVTEKKRRGGVRGQGLTKINLQRCFQRVFSTSKDVFKG